MKFYAFPVLFDLGNMCAIIHYSRICRMQPKVGRQLVLCGHSRMSDSIIILHLICLLEMIAQMDVGRNKCDHQYNILFRWIQHEMAWMAREGNLRIRAVHYSTCRAAGPGRPLKWRRTRAFIIFFFHPKSYLFLITIWKYMSFCSVLLLLLLLLLLLRIFFSI